MNALIGNDQRTRDAVRRHSLFDDAQALLTGTLFVALGLMLFRQVGLMTGGTAGIALIAHYASGWRFGVLFFAINLPFYWLAWRRMGRRFTLKTFIAVALLSVLSEQLPSLLAIDRVQPLFAAIAGGLLIGAGFLILFRHRASLGGLNVLVLWLQERTGWRAGYLQLALDIAILLASTPWVDVQRLMLSIVGAAAMSFALAVNHRPGRYVAF
ncbi:MAG TPA: YitT family protein [Burkholderiaceae bacterium]|nr:YitT family protein [Burkholderiaceae bacterium]